MLHFCIKKMLVSHPPPSINLQSPQKCFNNEATTSLAHAFITSPLVYVSRQKKQAQQTSDIPKMLLHIYLCSRNSTGVQYPTESSSNTYIHTFNTLKQTVPSYLANLISPYKPGRLLWSAHGNLPKPYLPHKTYPCYFWKCIYHLSPLIRLCQQQLFHKWLSIT